MVAPKGINNIDHLTLLGKPVSLHAIRIYILTTKKRKTIHPSII